jgi:CubicO group peptidase (beta-lactamase class C family)
LPRRPLRLHRFGAGLLLAGLGAPWSQQPDNPPVDAIFAEVTAPGSPGCALGVYRDGRIIYAKGYGLANVELNVPISPQSVFDVGSISKQFTAASILLLEQQGKLRLDDDIRKYIPELPDYSLQTGPKITLLNILNHTSGLRDYVSLFLLAGVHFDNVTTDDDALAFLVRQKGLNFVPGSDWQYTGSGYFLLSLVVKRLTGKTLKEFAAEQIFEPLGMVHTQYRNDHTSLIPNRVLAYETSQRGEYQLAVSYGEQNGDGMVQTSVEDLQKWDDNFYSGHVGGRDLTRKLEEVGTLTNGKLLEYAKGLSIGEYRGLRTFWHGGWSGGYRTFLVRFPDQHFSIACLCNNGRRATPLAYAVADVYLAGVMKQRELRANPALELPTGATGTYRDTHTGDVWRLAVVNGGLQAEYGDGVFKLRSLSVTDFDLPDNPYLHITLESRRDGARTLRIKPFEVLLQSFEPVEEARPSPAQLAMYAGDYWSAELHATYRLVLKDGKLRLKELVGADGIVHSKTIPANDLRPLSADEFDLRGASIMFRFTRDARHRVTGCTMSGFRERWIVFERREQ